MSTREEYVEKIKARLDEMNAEIDKIEARSRVLEADVKLEYDKKMNELRDRRQELDTRLSQLREAGVDSWQTLKEGVENSLSELVQGLSEAKERLEPVLAGDSR